MNCLNIYPYFWTKIYSLGELWPSLEWARMCLHHSCRRNLTDFCWVLLLVCIMHEGTVPDLSHTCMSEPFKFVKLSQAHYESRKNRWPCFQLLKWIEKKKKHRVNIVINHQTTYFWCFKNLHTLNPLLQGLHSCKIPSVNRFWSCLECSVVLITLLKRVSVTGLGGKWMSLNSLINTYFYMSVLGFSVYYISYQNN